MNQTDVAKCEGKLRTILSEKFGDGNFSMTSFADWNTDCIGFCLKRYGVESHYRARNDCFEHEKNPDNLIRMFADSLFHTWSNAKKTPAAAPKPPPIRPSPTWTPPPMPAGSPYTWAPPSLPAAAPTSPVPPRPSIRQGHRVAFAHKPTHLLGEVTKVEGDLVTVIGCEDGEKYVRQANEFVIV